MTWATDLVQALENLGGQAQLSDIYCEIKQIRPNLTSAWKSSVRERIQRHSSDSLSYNPDNPDLFYSVEGLGSGIWGLRSSLNKTPLVQVTAHNAPFGGIGHSGMGNYHGKEGFLTFSHAKTILVSPSLNPRIDMVLKQSRLLTRLLKWFYLK